MKKIDSENIIKLIDYLESQSTCYIIMEYCNQGDLECINLFFISTYSSITLKIKIVSGRRSFSPFLRNSEWILSKLLFLKYDNFLSVYIRII